MNDDVMDVEEAAAFVRLSKPLLRRAVKRGKLKAAVIPGGGGHRFLRSALIEWVDAGCPGCEADEKDGEE